MRTAASTQAGIELLCLPSGKYRLTVNGKVIANEVKFSEAVKMLDPGDNKGESANE